MIKKIVIKKLIVLMCISFTLVLLYFMPDNKELSYKTKIIYTSSEVKLHDIFLLDSNNRIALTNIAIENEKIIETGTQWRKDSVLKDRIEFFKNLGIDLGDNYEVYIQRQDIQKLLSTLKELAEKMISKRNDLYTQMMNKYYTSLEEYKINSELIALEKFFKKNENFAIDSLQRISCEVDG